MTLISEGQLEQARILLSSASRIGITTHSVVMPDGDAIGSLTGLSLALQNQGKHVIPILDGGVPQRFQFLRGTDQVRDSLLAASQIDLAIVLDCSSLTIAGEAGRDLFNTQVPTLVVDHHITNEQYGMLNLVSAEHLSTCEILVDLFEAFEWPITPEIADALMLGLVTDTNGLSIDRVAAPTLNRLMKLVEAGASLPHTIQRGIRQKEHNSLRLHGAVLSRLQFEDGLIWSKLYLEDSDNAGVERGNHFGLASALINDEEARISALFTESEQGTSVELRCTSDYNVSDLAFSMGGGGHTQAAGFLLHNLSPDEAAEKVLPMLKNLL
jgi:bifunctional oligoribonuclease and PAP phosphatase NrnA